MLLDEGWRRQALFMVRMYRRFNTFASQEPLTTTAVMLSLMVTGALWWKIIEVFVVNMQFEKMLADLREMNRNMSEIERRREIMMTTAMFLWP